ncbi:IS4 family transposase [Noviherbaspirillum soli]|uniref:IS4 family transposase n=1 Tax=Noviherbaspirillum soli TaxID=1064518 RepID=UPI001E30BC2D|nr:IS4 family transposase [Noviherbaspirillum soli]
MDCEVVFEHDERQAAYMMARKPIPPPPPSLNVVSLIAISGGFPGRKGNGEPGSKMIRTGLQRAMDFASGTRA